ncbi:MAG TPA: MarR family winged helix-turn-helix transcriptional regulator [Terriglobales bacterium]|nr:MarR family winged helix-turn-helix transcriptional regulator [Terriglobales bacterium]
MASKDEFNLQDFQALAEFRYNIRRFMRASEQILRPAGLKPQQYQLMLHIKGLPEGQQATIGDIAERLQIQHHSTVELVDRMSARGLIRRKRAGDDRRQVLLELTPKGEKVLREMANLHREELRNTGPALVGALRRVIANVQK